MLKSIINSTTTFSIFLISILLIAGTQIYSQNIINNKTESWETTKKGGISFRVTGAQPIEDYLKYAELFNKRDINFNFALGLGVNTISSEGYADGIRELQDHGHELIDLTPNFRTNYFYTIFNPQDYEDLPGVDHINGKKICLKFDDFDLSKRFKEGYLDILNDKVFGEQQFDELNYENIYLYFPTLDTMVLIGETIDNDLLSITDIWNDPIDLGEHLGIKYYWFSFKDIKMTDEALLLLGQESIKLAEHYNIQRPFSWIHPGWTFATAEDIKLTMGDQLGYTTGAVYSPANSVKTYNEYDPGEYRRFGMTTYDFHTDRSTLKDVKEAISNKIALHRIAMGSNYLNRKVPDFDAFLAKTDSLLEWCQNNSIPIKTHTEWGDILYSLKQDPYVNIFPPLNVDLDENGIPDGYYSQNPYYNATIDTTDGMPTANNYSLVINDRTGLCYIHGLGGVEKGENDFEIYTKGAPGNFISVRFIYGNDRIVFRFPAENSTWTKYNLSQSLNENKSLVIPDSISLIDIAIWCSDYSSGGVKISGMSLKSAQIDETAPSTPSDVQAIGLENKAKIMWEPSSDNDIKSYLIYKSLDSQFDPDTTSIVYSTLDTIYIDTDVEEGYTYYYKIAVMDFAGNKSSYSHAVSAHILTDVNSISILPKRYELYQNFPNPFNPTTKISFALPAKSNVKLTVYNSIGQIVTKLINKEMSAGYHTVQFDANNLSSGLYLFRIEAGNFIATKKMMLVK